MHKALVTAWPGLLITASVLILMGLIVAIFGYIPSIRNMDRVLNITLSMVGVSLGCFLLAFVVGFARDITQRA